MKHPPIVVGTDLSTPSRIAAQRAAQLAQQLGAPLVLVHVAGDFSTVGASAPVHPGWGTHLGGPAVTDGRRALSASAAQATSKLDTWIGRAGIAPDKRRVLVGPAHRSLLTVAKRERARLLVAGVHRPRASIESFLLGSTAERLLRTGTQPVLLARQGVKGPYKEVLIPLDLTDVGLRVLAAVEEFAPRAKYHVVHFAGVPDTRDPERMERLEALKATLDKLVKAARLRKTRCKVEVVEDEPREGILRQARRRGVDLVAMGTRARKGVERFLLGSVADYALRAAPTDVLAVPPVR